jgi:hypothetical protein
MSWSMPLPEKPWCPSFVITDAVTPEQRQSNAVLAAKKQE